MNVLVIGGSYFVGRALVEALLRDGERVTVLNRGTHRLEGVEQLVADRDVPGQMEAVLGGRSFDWVVDTSCYTGDQSRLAFDALKGRFGHWVQLSSSAVYVEDGTIPMDEDHTTGRSLEWGDYGLGKWQADEFLLAEVRDHRAPVTIIRPPYLYGPRNNVEREQFLWSRLLRGRLILIPGSGQTPIQFLHVEDLYGVVRRVLANPDRSLRQVFDVANRKAITFKALVELLADVAGMEATLFPVPYQSLGVKPRDFFPFRDFPCVLDVRKVEVMLGWTAQYDLKTGFTQTFRTYDPTWLVTRSIDVEVEDRIATELGRLSG